MTWDRNHLSHTLTPRPNEEKWQAFGETRSTIVLVMGGPRTCRAPRRPPQWFCAYPGVARLWRASGGGAPLPGRARILPTGIGWSDGRGAADRAWSFTGGA